MQTLGKCSVTIKPGFCLFAAATLLIIPIEWVFSWFLAAAFHELCHCLTLFLCCIPIHSIDIDLTGAKINTASLTAGKELVCALAGPLGGLSLCLLSSLFPRLALCALIQSVYNLLPLYPFDGGRILSCLFFSIMGHKKGEKWMGLFEMVFMILLVLLALYLAFSLRLGLLPLVFVLFLFLRSGKLKFPCKAGKQIVQ